jgi:DUF4097 and DUF4098 domain-containing protein YvlB
MDERVEQTFSVGGDPILTLENVVGDIRISSWERPEIHVVAVQRGRSKAEIEMRQDGDHLIVRTHDRWVESFLRWLGGDRPAIVDYTVEVPTTCRVNVSEVDGLVSLSGLRPEIHLSLVSGRAQVEALSGEIEISLVSARLEGRDLRGRAALKTVSGDINLAECQFDSLDVDTVSGQAQAATPLAPDGHYRFNSVSGDVVLAVPQETRTTAMGESVSGHVRSDLPASVERQGFGTWLAAINGGGVEVRFNSVSGDLCFTTSTPVPSMMEMPPTPVSAAAIPPQPPMTTMDVLKAVEAGDMSVDEALKRLGK